MHTTIFAPQNEDIKGLIIRELGVTKADRAIHFLSELYILHKCFDSDENISGNIHKLKSIHSSKLRQILGRQYRKAISTLERLGLVEVHPLYCPNRYSMGYRLTSRLLEEPFVKVGESRRTRISYERTELINALPLVYQKIYSNANELRFDYNAAMNFIAKDVSLRPLQKNAYQNFAELAKIVDFSPTVCGQGRLHYMLTFCPRKLRQFFRVRGANLMLIDIKSCQVLLHTCLYPSNCEEKGYFDHVCSTGYFWELINSTLKKPYDLSDEDQKKDLKQACFQQIFYTSKDYLYVHSALVKGFREHFPILYDLMLQEKRRLHKNREEMACKMQRLESEIVIHGAIAGLQADFPDNLFLTIHDCIICEDCMVDEVKNALSQAVSSKIGVKPGLDVKPMQAPLIFVREPTGEGKSSYSEAPVTPTQQDSARVSAIEYADADESDLEVF